MPTSNFQPIRLLDLDCCYKFIYLMANSVDPDQLAFQKPTDLDLHCLQRQGISGFSRKMVNSGILLYMYFLFFPRKQTCFVLSCFKNSPNWNGIHKLYEGIYHNNPKYWGRQMSKQYRPWADALECGIWSRSTSFATRPATFLTHQ